MTRILITGGAGFIGTHLAERLLKDGHYVHVMDNFSTGRMENVRRLSGYHRFSWAPGDVTQPADFMPFGPPVKGRIYNLACMASPKAYSANPVETLWTCTAGAKAVLDLAMTCGARILQASTSEVYGDPQPGFHPQKETYWGHVNPTGPRSCYDEGKRAAETFCYEYAKTGVAVRVARIFNTYGPRMQPDDGRVVSNFICQGLKGQDITVFGDGKQSRSLCYIDDTVEGLIRLMESPVCDPVNIGNPHEVTMHELATLIRAMTGHKSRLVRRQLPQDDPRQRCPDIGRARWALDWAPKVELGAGLAKTVEYFREVLNVQDIAGPGSERPAAVAADPQPY